MTCLRHQNQKNENTEIKCLNDIRKYRILTAKNSLSELGKDSKELRYGEFKDGEIN